MRRAHVFFDASRDASTGDQLNAELLHAIDEKPVHQE